MKENVVYRVVVFKIYMTSAWVQMMSSKQLPLIIFKKSKTNTPQHPIVLKIKFRKKD